MRVYGSRVLRLGLIFAGLACVSGSGPDAESRPGLIALPSFAAADENHDESLDREEFQKLANTLFERADTNHDGALNLEEYKLLRPPERDRPRSGGGGGGGRRRGSRGEGGSGYPGGGFPPPTFPQ